MPVGLYGTVAVEGRIIDLPRYDSQKRVGSFTIETSLISKGVNQNCLTPYRLRVSYYRSEAIPFSAGSRWHFYAKLRQKNGQASPGAYNYEDYLFQRNIDAVGYLKLDYVFEELEETSSFSHHALRQTVQSLINNHLPASTARAFIKALIIGDRSEISQDAWQTVSATGTSHLLAISGLHIGLIAVLFGQLAGFLWRRSSRLCLLVAAPHLSAIIAFIAAVLYTALAGFSVPTQRALLMLSIWVLYYLSLCHTPRWWLWLIAFMTISLLDIRSTITPGFTLSFLAVAILLTLPFNNIGWKEKIVSLIRTQWTISITMAPIVVWFFGHSSLVAPVINLLAVPLMSVILLPLLFAGILIAPFTHYLLYVGHYLMGWFIALLELAAKPSWALWHLASPSLVVSILATIILWRLCLSKRRLIPAICGLLLLGWQLLQSAQQPAEGLAAIAVLDVGQGLAVLVRTQNHALIYDTGLPSVGRRIVAPVLRYYSVTLDKIIVSHGDNDHIGGLPWLQNQYPDVPVIHQSDCTGEWVWDKVSFRFLTTGFQEGNNGSCVLLVRSNHDSFLLTGDIEKAAEKKLILRHPDLQANWLLSPHHGSQTSSSSPFLQLIKPHTVLISAGFQSRFGHPHHSVLDRYNEQGIRVFDTACSGTIEFMLGASDTIAVSEWRRKAASFWWRQCGISNNPLNNNLKKTYETTPILGSK